MGGRRPCPGQVHVAYTGAWMEAGLAEPEVGSFRSEHRESDGASEVRSESQTVGRRRVPGFGPARRSGVPSP